MGDLTQIRTRDVEEGLDALTKVVQNFNENKKKQVLFDEEDTIFLQISLGKIPPLKKYKFYKFNLPHSLYTDSSTICLIVGDVDRKSREVPDEDHPMKIFLRENGIDAITEVITLRELRTEYKPFEAKRNLCNTYDLFLVDRKIKECLPRLLGKSFFQKRKVPFGVTVKEHVELWENQLAKILSQTVLYVNGRGTSCTLQVGHKMLTKSQLLGNIKCAIMQLHQTADLDIIGLHLKTSRSIAIPLYLSFKQPLINTAEEKPCTDTSLPDGSENFPIKPKMKTSAKKLVVKKEKVEDSPQPLPNTIEKKHSIGTSHSSENVTLKPKVEDDVKKEKKSAYTPKENNIVKVSSIKTSKKRKADAVTPLKAKKKQA